MNLIYRKWSIPLLLIACTWQLDILATAVWYICPKLNYKTGLFAWWGDSYVAVGIQYYCNCDCPWRHCSFNPFLCDLLPFHLSYVAVSWSSQLSEFYHNRTSAMPWGLENAVVIWFFFMFKMIWPFLCFTALFVFRYPLLTAIYNVCFEKHPPSEMIEVLKRHL